LAELADAGLVASDGGVGDAATGSPSDASGDGSASSTPDAMTQTAGDGAADSTADVGTQTASDGSADAGSKDATVGSDATVSGDGATPVDATPKTDSNTPDVGIVGNSCPNAQTQFGGIGQGDSNPNFTSGIGIRTATQMLVFSGESTTVDAGADDAAAVVSSHVWLQAFDPSSGDAVGAAAPLFSASGSESYIQVLAGAVDPNGDVVVVYSFNDNPTRNITGCSAEARGRSGWCGAAYGYGDGLLQGGGLYAEFLSPATDGGVAGLQAMKNVRLDTSVAYGQPHAMWIPAFKAFAITWQYASNGTPYLALSKFLPNGNSAGGGANPVDYGTVGVDPYPHDFGAAASCGTFTGVAFFGNGGPYINISVLDTSGNPIAGSPVSVGNIRQNWTTLGSVSQGFVQLYDNGAGTTEAFVPVSADAGITIPDAGFSGFVFPGAVSAVDVRVENDDTGGAGGVGVALLYANGVSFAYINADGVTHTNPQSVLTPMYPYQTLDLVHISQFGGSFVVSDYSSAENRTYLAASGCAQ